MSIANTAGPLEFLAQNQQDPARRMCGAASLEMVYRSFGLAISQEEIWPQILRRDHRGTWNAATYLLAKEAIARGLAAAVIQASRPWEMLQAASASTWRVILNHRPLADSPTGHFSVLLRADSSFAVLHDPQYGPRREIQRDRLLDLWLPASRIDEITGFVLVAIGNVTADAEQCVECGASMPQGLQCSLCDGRLFFPQAILGCTRRSCSARLWERVFCPNCDSSTSELVSC